MWKDHPLTNLPVLFVHPCRTAEVMRELSATGGGGAGGGGGGVRVDLASYLSVWLGVVGAPVGLNVPVDYDYCCEKSVVK